MIQVGVTKNRVVLAKQGKGSTIDGVWQPGPEGKEKLTGTLVPSNGQEIKLRNSGEVATYDYVFHTSHDVDVTPMDVDTGDPTDELIINGARYKVMTLRRFGPESPKPHTQLFAKRMDD